MVIAFGEWMLPARGESPPRAEVHWNQFRGPNGDGKALTSNLPIEFSETDKIRWKVPLPVKAGPLQRFGTTRSG